jgi:hypothetical protein
MRSGTFVFRSPTLPFPVRRTEEYGLSDRNSADASDRAVDSRGVLVRTNDRRARHLRRSGVGIHLRQDPGTGERK